jgi:hypothetical protein
MENEINESTPVAVMAVEAFVVVALVASTVSLGRLANDWRKEFKKRRFVKKHTMYI